MRLEPREEDLAHCAEVIRLHSRSFWAASRLLPSGVREKAIATYAFCRLADDDVDAPGPGSPEQRHRRTRSTLERIYDGQIPDVASARAFAWVVSAAEIPVEEPTALLDGMEQDLGVVRIESVDDLLGYAYRAAGVVGRMMARIMGCADDEALRDAADLGIAMQLTNIGRDVREDAARDRIYLPGSWLEEADGSFADVLATPFGPSVARANQRVLALADEHYERGIRGIGRLPRRCRPAILAAALLYREIGNEVRRRGGVHEERVVVSRTSRLRLLARGVAGGVLGLAWPRPPALAGDRR